MLPELGFRFLAQRPSPILLFLPPDPHIPPHFARNLLLRPQNAIFKPSKNLLIFCFHFFSKKSRKSWILVPKTLPKPSQNPLKIDVPKNMRFFMDFCSIFVACCKSRTSKFMRPRSVLLGFHKNQMFAFGKHFGFEKPIKNHSKTKPEPFKNRC